MDLRAVFEFNLNAVCNLQTGGLTEVLNAVDQLTRNTFFDEFIRQLDVQRDSIVRIPLLATNQPGMSSVKISTSSGTIV